MESHPTCEVEGCCRKATQLHHRAGRAGYLKWYPKYFMAVCGECHQKIDFKAKEWAYERGYKIYLTAEQMRLERDEAYAWARQMGYIA